MPDQNEPVTLGAPITAVPADQSGQASPAPQASGQSPEAEPVTLGAPITAAPEEGLGPGFPKGHQQRFNSKNMEVSPTQEPFSATEVAKGMGKELIPNNLAKVAHKVLGENVVPQAGVNAMNELATPHGQNQQLGATATQMLEFLLPGMAEEKGVTMAGKLATASKLMSALEESPAAMAAVKAAMKQAVPVAAKTVGAPMAIRAGIQATGESPEELGGSLLTGAKEAVKAGVAGTALGTIGTLAPGALGAMNRVESGPEFANFNFSHMHPLARTLKGAGLTDSIAKSASPLIKTQAARNGIEINGADDAIKSINLAKQELMTRPVTTDAQKVALNDHIGALNTTKDAIEKAQAATSVKPKVPSNSPLAKAGEIAQELPIAGKYGVKPLKNIYNIIKRSDTAEQLDAKIAKAFSANTSLDHPILDTLLPPGEQVPTSTTGVKVPAGKVVPKQAAPEVAPNITPFKPENPITSANVQVPAGPRVPKYNTVDLIKKAEAAPEAVTAAEPIPGTPEAAAKEAIPMPASTAEVKPEVKVASPEVAKEVFEKEPPTTAKGVLEPQPWKEYKGPTDGDNASLQALTHYSDSDLTDIANSEKFKERGLDISNIDKKDPLYSEKVIQQIHDHLTDDEMEAFGKEARTQEAGRNNPDSLTHVVKHPANQPVAQHLQDMADAIKDKNIGAEGIRDRIALQNASHAVSRYPEDVTGMTAKQLQNKIKGVGDTTAGHMRDFLDKNAPEAEAAPAAEKATEAAPKAEVVAPKTPEVAPKPKKIVANPTPPKRPAKDLYAGLADNLSGINEKLSKPGRLSKAATETLQDMKQKVEAKNADRILGALNKTQAQEGLVTGVSKVRKELPDMNKEDFDKGVKQLTDQKKLYIHDHGAPFTLSEADRNKLVHIPEYGKDSYYVGIAKRTKE